MPKLYTQTFTVAGRGEFPLDMLRRDTCYPADGTAVEIITNTLKGNRPARNAPAFRVDLVRVVNTTVAWPTEGRWASFGWVVVNGSVVSEKVAA